MKGTPAIYLGRIVDKKNFRVVVYGPNGEKKLVESWDEFEGCMQSGIWFATVEDVEAAKLCMNDAMPVEEALEEKPKVKGKAKGKAKPKAVEVDELEENDGEIAPDELDDMVYEVKDGE